MEMTSFGHEKDLYSTILGRLARLLLVNIRSFYDQRRHFHDVQNTTIVLQISTSIARGVWFVLAGYQRIILLT